jgi:lysophospholipase L1-like esterase
VFLFPYESQVYLEKYDASSVDWLRGLCEERNIPFVSLIEQFRALARTQEPPLQLFLRGDRYHPNRAGYALVAKYVLELVEAQAWLPKAH